MSTAAVDGIAPGADDGFALQLAQRPAMPQVQSWAVAAVPQVTGEVLEDLLLVVTELVSNAYDHGRHPQSLRLCVRGDRLRVEVTDTSSDVPVLGRSRIAYTRGRGMVLVAALTADWGHDLREASKTVWAELHTAL